MAVVKNSKKTTNEAELHHWIYTGQSWIRLTNKAYKDAINSASNNLEDQPKISFFKKILYFIINKL